MCREYVCERSQCLGLSTINDVLIENRYNWHLRAYPQNQKQKCLVEKLVIDEITSQCGDQQSLRVAPPLMGQAGQEEVIESAAA